MAVSAALLVTGCGSEDSSNAVPNDSQSTVDAPNELAMTDEGDELSDLADTETADTALSEGGDAVAGRSTTTVATKSSSISNTSASSPGTTSSNTTSSTGQSTSTVAAKTVPLTTSDIDCISGEFTFQFSDPNNAGQVTNIKVLRDGTLDDTLTENSNGLYRAQIKDSSEVVTAVVDYTAAGASYSHTHPLADCSQIFGGSYKICNGEGIHTAYPSSWYAQPDVEVDNPGFCGYFRSVPQDGYSDHEITRKGFAGQAMSQVVAAYNNDPDYVVVSTTPVASIGTLLARPGNVLEIAYPNDPTAVVTKIYLFESGGNTQEIRADQIHSGTDSFAVLSAMMDTMTLFEQ